MDRRIPFRRTYFGIFVFFFCYPLLMKTLHTNEYHIIGTDASADMFIVTW